MSGKSGHRVTGSKPTDSSRTSAKTDGAFGKENVDQLVSETERNVDSAVDRVATDRGEDQAGFHQGEHRKRTSEADALHCPTCGRRFESQQGLEVHSRECAAAKAATGGGANGTSKDEIEPTHEWKSTP